MGLYVPLTAPSEGYEQRVRPASDQSDDERHSILVRLLPVVTVPECAVGGPE
jgi:hypothetical protein